MKLLQFESLVAGRSPEDLQREMVILKSIGFPNLAHELLEYVFANHPYVQYEKFIKAGSVEAADNIARRVKANILCDIQNGIRGQAIMVDHRGQQISL